MTGPTMQFPVVMALLKIAAGPFTICAWCPGFDPGAESNRGATHGICRACRERMEVELG